MPVLATAIRVCTENGGHALVFPHKITTSGRKIQIISQRIKGSTIFYFTAGEIPRVFGINVSLIGSFPPGSFITGVHTADRVGIRKYKLNSMHSRSSNNTLKSSFGNSSETEQDCVKAAYSSTFPLGLCHHSKGRLVMTTSHFKPLAGDTLTVGFSGTAVDNHTYNGYFTLEIACSYDGTNNFYRSLEHDVECLNRTLQRDMDWNSTKGYGLESYHYQWESLHSNSKYDSFVLEVEFSKLSPFINESTVVFAVLKSTINCRQADVKTTRKVLAFYYLKSQAQSDIVRMPIDEALTPRRKIIHLDLNFRTEVKGIGFKSLPYVQGAVKLVMLSRSNTCSRNKCKEGQPSAEKGKEDDQVNGCYTIEQLYKSCNGEC